MKKIRIKTFETNSSSAHSLVLSDIDYDTIVPSEDGVISLSFSDIHDEEYGDSYTYIRAIDKLNYCMQCVYDEWPCYGNFDSSEDPELQYKVLGKEFIRRMKMIYKVVKAHTGAKKIKIIGDRASTMCALNYYHMEDVFDKEEIMKDFIFGKNSYARSGY